MLMIPTYTHKKQTPSVETNNIFTQRCICAFFLVNTILIGIKTFFLYDLFGDSNNTFKQRSLQITNNT